MGVSLLRSIVFSLNSSGVPPPFGLAEIVSTCCFCLYQGEGEMGLSMVDTVRSGRQSEVAPSKDFP